ncbi:OsmC family protein [Georgenia sunbinii]|uniref:OsmC family protein n=1 Tax=Georgenia sunbinii TaxID=3117728 RepID=UPI002F260338
MRLSPDGPHEPPAGRLGIVVVMTTTTSATTDPTPRLADFSVDGRWEGSLATRVTTRQFEFVVAEPESLGGTDAAPNPIEYLLGSLAGCVSVVVETVAQQLGITVTALDVRPAGTIDLRGFLGTADVSPHFQRLTLALTLQTPTPEADLEELKRLVARRCPLLNLIRDAGVDVVEEWQVLTAG